MKGRILRIEVTVIVEPDGEGFHVYCPNLKGFHVGGDTIEEALQNAEDGISLYLNSLARHDHPLPIGPFLSVERDETPEIPVGAFLRNIQLQWPSQSTSGTS